jgi:hypothetical protein
MKSIHALTLSALLVLPLATQAQSRNSSGYGSMSYSYLDGRLVVVEPDGGGSFDGVRFGGSLQFQPQLYGLGSITTYGDSGFDFTFIDLGIGYRQALQSDLDLVAMGGVVLADFDGPGAADDSDTGLWLVGGVRGIATPQIEYGAYAEYRSVFDSGDITLTGEGLLHMNRNLALVASLGLSDDANTLTLGARWSFAR